MRKIQDYTCARKSCLVNGEALPRLSALPFSCAVYRHVFGQGESKGGGVSPPVRFGGRLKPSPRQEDQLRVLSFPI